MDGKIDGLTVDYIGSADKISVILFTREMKQRDGGGEIEGVALRGPHHKYY